jgi:hypothetical protein
MPRTTPSRIPGGSKALVKVMRGFTVVASFRVEFISYT